MSFKETEIGKIPSEWEIKMIQELGEVISGGTPKTKEMSYWDGEILWITPKDLSEFNGKYISCGSRSITKEGLEKSSAKMLPKGTVLFSSRAPIGYLAIANRELCTNQGFKNIVCNSKVSTNEFVYYLMKQNTSTIENIAGGSTFKEISGKSIKEFKVALPPLDEQKAIAKILSDLDEKIEINNKINKNLEEMAQTIFKRWFVDFEFTDSEGKPYKSNGGEMVESELGMIPVKFKCGELNELANLTMGLSPKSSSYNLEEVGIPLLNGAADFENGIIKANKYTTQETRVCDRGELVFCIRATIGNITFADRQYCLGRGVAALNPLKRENIGLVYMNLLNSIEKLKLQATGSVILGLSKPDINNMKLIIPSDDVKEEFSRLFLNLFEKRSNIFLENEKLEKIRETLLPKLMSGEIRVPLK